MRILRVIASMDPKGGGPSESVRQTTRRLREWGHSIEVLCMDPPVPKVEDGDGLTIHRLGPGRLGYAWTPRLIPWLLANKGRFDAVICHGLWLFPSYAVWRALRGNAKKLKAEMLTAGAPAPLSGEATPQNPRQRDRQPNDFSVSGFQRSSVSAPPYFVFPHGMLDPWFQRMDQRPFKAVRNWFYWKAVEHRVVRDAGAVCFTCEEERRLARIPFRPYQVRERVVSYGTAHPPPFRPEMTSAFHSCCPELKDRPYLLFLGRVHPKKGVDLLVKAYAEGRRSEDGRWKLVEGEKFPALVIAGPGLDCAYGREMIALVKTLNLPPTPNSQLPAANSQLPHVFFPGMLEGDAKWGAFYGCEAFVLPSHQENFGIAVVEALACGKPVLLSDKVNIWREIEGDGAAFVELDTQEGTTRLLRRWFGTGTDTRCAMGIAGRACFEKRFTIENATRALLQVIGNGYV